MGFFSSVAMIGMGVAGALQSAKSKSNDAKNQAAMQDYNARVAEQDAAATEEQTTFAQLRQRRTAARIMGGLRAKLGASGALMDEGAPAALTADQAFELEMENTLMGQQGRTEAAKYRSEAAGYRMGAQFARKSASNALTAGWLNAGRRVIGGLGGMYEQDMFNFGGSRSGGLQPYNANWG